MIIIATSFLSIIMSSRKLYRHHWTSVAVIFIGLFLVGLVEFMSTSPTNTSQENVAIGIILILLASMHAGVYFVSEEKLVTQHKLDPLLTTGTEGLWGIFLISLVLTALQYIPCHHQSLCPSQHLDNTL